MNGSGTRRPTAGVAAAQGLLTALDPPGLPDDQVKRTAERMAAGYAELLSRRVFEPTTFPNEIKYDELVLVRGVRFASVCAHHMFPFSGVADVGYVPGDRLLGLSKLARVVQHFAADTQVQERLTAQVADWLMDAAAAVAAGVVVRAEHTCMTLRGACAAGADAVTMVTRGRLSEDRSARAEFVALLQLGGSR